jgi:hypothetical protein
VFFEASFYIHFDFVIIWQKNIVSKTARKMLVILTSAEVGYGAEGQDVVQCQEVQGSQSSGKM